MSQDAKHDYLIRERYGDVPTMSIELHPCRTAKIVTKPFFWCVDLCENLDNCCLYFCGFSLVLVPVIVAYWAVVLAVLFAELCVLVCLLFPFSTD